MIPSHVLGFIDEVMTKSFNEGRKKTHGVVPPFGGRRVIFAGDMQQLPPVDGEALYLMPSRAGSGLKVGRAVRGHSLYVKYLRPNVTILERSHRNVGLLYTIADRLRSGKQTADDLNMLELQCRRSPHADVDRGIHYSNEAATVNNWRTLWKACKQTGRHLFLAKASYHETETNQLVVSMLSGLSAKAYAYAQHQLCLAVGCEVRLVVNLDVAAGLVNSSTGTVVEVLYDAADAKHLAEGKHPPPYVVVVDFPDFTGFKDCDEPHPFPNHPTWVPVTRRKFSVAQRDLPANVRQSQQTKDCWRLQFPLDLSMHLTAHRAQGATMGSCRVLVDLGLDNPSTRVPADAGSILYVAITRAVHLRNVFVRPILLSVWKKLGKSVADEARRDEEAVLRESARDFAAGCGQLDIVEDEFAHLPDCSGNDAEWQELVSAAAGPIHQDASTQPAAFADADFEAVAEGEHFCFRSRPVPHERHIGIDQGTKNFAVVAVDKRGDGGLSKVIFAALYEDLNLPQRFDATHVALALNNKRDLLSLMQVGTIYEFVFFTFFYFLCSASTHVQCFVRV
jgi:hypothetical protein